MPTIPPVQKVKAVEDFNHQLELETRFEFLKFLEGCKTQIELNRHAENQDLLLFEYLKAEAPLPMGRGNKSVRRRHNNRQDP